MQSKKMSVVESFVQPAIGFLISYAFTYWGLPFFFDVHFGLVQALSISSCYFIISVMRMYIIRRLFNMIKVK